jgi:hypothetical protein
VELHGLEHLQAAVSNGKGVVLWISQNRHVPCRVCIQPP